MFVFCVFGLKLDTCLLCVFACSQRGATLSLTQMRATTSGLLTESSFHARSGTGLADATMRRQRAPTATPRTRVFFFRPPRAWTQGRSLAGRRLQPRLPADALAQPVCATGARHAKQAVERLLGRVLFENFRAQRRPWQSWDWRLGADRRQSKCEPAEGVPADIYCSPRKVGVRV